ncbi:MAG: carboxypeptidase regulatory-like domain-containing protein [Candidatus Acidiferrales bacterium]
MNRTNFILGLAVFGLSLGASSAASAQSNYQVINVSNGGTVSGVVKWTGERPKPLTLPISKDEATCDPDKAGARDLERLVIGPDGGVKNTVVYLRGLTSGKAWDLPEARRDLDQKQCRYLPHVLLVQEGTNINIKSSDPILHTVHMVGVADYNLPFPMMDVTLSRPLRKAGIVDLKCNAGHIWMNGVVFVVSDPYYAVTDENGEFRISNIPSGEYEIVAWHEGWRVAREEPVLDVATQTKTKRLFFTDPMTWQKKVSVAANGRSNVEFQISDRER